MQCSMFRCFIISIIHFFCLFVCLFIFFSQNKRIKVRSKPIFLVSNDEQTVDETVAKSTLSSTSASSMTEQYQSSEFENYPDTRVRRAFLWIKVDETVKKKKKKKKTKYDDEDIDLPKTMTKNRKLAYKSNKNRHRSMFNNFFRLWVFRIIEPISVSVREKKKTENWLTRIEFVYFVIPRNLISKSS